MAIEDGGHHCDHGCGVAEDQIVCRSCDHMQRRGLLSFLATGVAAAGLLSAGTPRSLAAGGTTMTADEALAKLKAGNQRFLSAPELCAADMAKRRAEVAKGQSPWATILTCSDSRVSPELIFGGVGLGELFVARNAGNVADTAAMGTIEYGAEHLGSPLVVVLGHQRCGAVEAACEVVAKHTKLPGFIAPMVEAIVPAAKAVRGKPGDFVDNTVWENARLQAKKISTQSKIIAHLEHEGRVKVLYGHYDLDKGAVDFV
jgi:carbonic anhydrase